MKYFVTFFTFLFMISCISKKNTIPELDTNKEIARFFKKNIDRNYTFKDEIRS